MSKPATSAPLTPTTSLHEKKAKSITDSGELAFSDIELPSEVGRSSSGVSYINQSSAISDRDMQGSETSDLTGSGHSDGSSGSSASDSRTLDLTDSGHSNDLSGPESSTNSRALFVFDENDLDADSDATLFLEEKEKPVSQRHNTTIGIIGLDPAQVAEVNRLLVEIGNKNYGFENDQDGPEILAIGIPPKMGRSARQHLPSEFLYCHAFGCDIVAITEQDGLEGIKKANKDPEIEALSLNPRESLENFAKRILAASAQIKTPRRPDLYFDQQKFQNSEEREAELKRMEQNLKKDRQEREERMQKIIQENQDALVFVKNTEFVGVGGGAGPAASVDSVIELARYQTPFIHYSASRAPGKNLCEMGRGFPYDGHYQNIVALFEMEGARETCLLFPCNTIHISLHKFCTGIEDRVVDLREATLNALIENYGIATPTEVILLGTETTTGVNWGDGRKGIYQALIDKNRANQEKYKNIKFVLPTSAQQNQISNMKNGAIFILKKGDFAGCRTILLNVAGKMRQELIGSDTTREPKDILVVAACTELPTSIRGKMGFIEHGIVNPGDLAVAEARRRITQAEAARNKKQSKSAPSSKDSDEPYSGGSGSDSEDEPSATKDDPAKKVLIKDKDSDNNFQVSVFKNVTGSSAEGREVAYYIRAEEGDVRARNDFLRRTKREICEKMEQDERNRVKQDHYIVIHKPSPELETSLMTWLLNNKLTDKIQDGQPPSSKKKKVIEETKGSISTSPSGSGVAVPAASKLVAKTQITGQNKQ